MTLSKENHPPGFTLLELLIVILLMGVMTTLIVGIFKRAESGKNHPKVSQLKELVLQGAKGSRELFCLDQCTQCFFRENDKIAKAGFGLPPMDVYVVDDMGEAQRIDFGRYRDHPVCLRFRGYADGHTTRLIIATGDKFYYFPRFFGKVGRYPSLEEAVARWRENDDLLHNRWDYY